MKKNSYAKPGTDRPKRIVVQLSTAEHRRLARAVRHGDHPNMSDFVRNAIEVKILADKILADNTTKADNT